MWKKSQDDVSKRLKIKDNSPLLQIERCAYDKDNNLLEYMLLCYEASMYSLEVELDFA